MQFDRSRVKVAGELKNFLLTLSVDPRIHQTIDIVVAHIPKAYGMWLTRNWLEKCKGCFSTDWSHLWLPYLGRPNKTKIMREPYMKQTFTDLNDLVKFLSTLSHILNITHLIHSSGIFLLTPQLLKY